MKIWSKNLSGKLTGLPLIIPRKRKQNGRTSS